MTHSVRLRIEGQYLFGMSVGTVAVVKLVQKELDCGLLEAKRVVDDALSAEGASIRLPSAESANRFLSALGDLPQEPRIFAELDVP